MYTRIYLGLDGGATKTSLTALNLSREVVAEETGKPANFQVIGAATSFRKSLGGYGICPEEIECGFI